jgi:hypothetical protein
MLMRRLTTVLISVFLIAVPLAVSSPAFAGGGTGGVACTPGATTPGCDVHAGTGGQSGGGTQGGQGGGGRGGDGKCRDPQGKVIPCERDGGYAGKDGCYYQPTDPPASVISALGGQPAGAGGWYLKVCYNDQGQATAGLGGPVWVAGAAPPVVSPAVLAREARSRLKLPSAVVALNPPGRELVNLPVWMWLAPASWKSQSATATAGAVSVTATARPVSATWSMGDGSSITCQGPGTPWSAGTDPRASSPNCGYTYLRPSSGAGYPVSVTVTWVVTWAGAGQAGTVPGLETNGAANAVVQESQALVAP